MTWPVAAVLCVLSISTWAGAAFIMNSYFRNRYDDDGES